MAQLKGKFIGVNEISDAMIRFLNGGWLRGRNFAGTADINMMRVNPSNSIEFAAVPEVSDDPSTANGLARKSYVDANAGIPASQKGAANGVAPLDAGAKILAVYLPDSIVGALNYQGAWDASGGAFPSVSGMGDKGKFWVVSVAGTINPGAHDVAIGDWLAWDGAAWDVIDHSQSVSSVNGKQGALTLYTNDITEPGSPTNMWFTVARAKSAVVLNTLVGSQTDQAPSVAAINSALGGKENTLTAGTSSQYYRGDKTWATLNTDAVPAGSTNKYYVLATAQSDLLVSSIGGGDTTHAPTAATVSTALGGKEPTLAAGTSSQYYRGDKTWATLNTDAVPAGTTNKYYTVAQAQTDLLASSISSGDTTHAPTGGAVFTALAGKENTVTGGKEIKTLVAGDITNQYIDLAQVIKANSLDLVVGGLMQTEGVDYDVSLTGGAAGKTRVTFKTGGDLATGGAAALVATDVVVFKYRY